MYTSDEYTDYWQEENTTRRKVRVRRLSRRLRGMVDGDYGPPEEGWTALDWLEHLANLPWNQDEVAWHICDDAMAEILFEHSRLVYDIGLDGWSLQLFRYEMPLPDVVTTYPEIRDEGAYPLPYCPWCGERLPEPDATIKDVSEER